MDEYIQQCYFPDIGEPLAAALRAAVRFIFDAHRPIGILLGGGPRDAPLTAMPPLNLLVVHNEAYRQRRYRRFEGAPVKIEINSPGGYSAFLDAELASGRPYISRQLHGGTVIYDGSPVVDALCDRARLYLKNIGEYDPHYLTGMRSDAALALAAALDVAGRDPVTANMLLADAAWRMITYWFLKAGKAIPPSGEIVQQLMATHPDLGVLTEKFYLAPGLPERRAFAQKIAAQTIETDGFFEWDGPPEAVNI